MNKPIGIPAWMALIRAPNVSPTVSTPTAGADVDEGPVDRFDDLIRELFSAPKGSSLPPESVPVPADPANDLDGPLPDPMSPSAWHVPENVVPLAPAGADLSPGFPPPLRTRKDPRPALAQSRLRRPGRRNQCIS